MLIVRRVALTQRDIIQATHKDGKDAGIELVQPPAGSQPGDRVYFEGTEFESTCLSTRMTGLTVDL